MGRSRRVDGHGITIALLLVALLAPRAAIAAQKTSPDEFPPNPLELREPDPLLPQGVPGRPLTAAEQKTLAAQLDQLNLQAQTQFRAGNKLQAFDTWNRELRLRRFLGPIPEVQALGRVGDVAWQENQSPEVRWITQRLDALLLPLMPTAQPTSTITTPADRVGGDRRGLLQALGLAYQQVRQFSSAVQVYQQVLADARQRKDFQTVEATLITLGQLHLSGFDYPNAAEVYRELLANARATANQPNVIAYLTQLAYIHEQAKQPEPAIDYEQQLIDLYQTTNQPNLIPALKIKIADNYQTLAKYDLAEQNYQSAYQLSQPLLQFGIASDALQKLGALYLTNERSDAALRVYDYLVAVQQQAYNYYGVMDAYDQLGQIHLARREFPQALISFQRGLSIARQLKYREDYFTAQIQKINQQPNR